MHGRDSASVYRTSTGNGFRTRKSGFALASKIAEVLTRSPETAIWILGNHGLVVCGEDGHAAEQLLYQVEERLAITPRCAPGASQGLFAEVLTRREWKLPANERIHALATDEASWRILSRGVLYPCQAIFLPGTIPVHSAFKTGGPRDGECRAKPQVPRMVEGHGVLCHRGMTQAEQEMLSGLANVVQRIDQSASLRYLTVSEVGAVFSGGAASYRRIADANCYSAV